MVRSGWCAVLPERQHQVGHALVARGLGEVRQCFQRVRADRQRAFGVQGDLDEGVGVGRRGPADERFLVGDRPNDGGHRFGLLGHDDERQAALRGQKFHPRDRLVLGQPVEVEGGGLDAERLADANELRLVDLPDPNERFLIRERGGHAHGNGGLVMELLLVTKHHCFLPDVETAAARWTDAHEFHRRRGCLGEFALGLVREMGAVGERLLLGCDLHRERHAGREFAVATIRLGQVLIDCHCGQGHRILQLSVAQISNLSVSGQIVASRAKYPGENRRTR